MQSKLQATQQAQMAGHTKLTAVSIWAHGRKSTHFVNLQHDARGAAVLPMATLDKLLDKHNVRRGDTFTVA